MVDPESRFGSSGDPFPDPEVERLEVEWLDAEAVERTWGAIGDLNEEESSEDELGQISVELKHMLEAYEVRGMRGADHDSLIKLWHEMDLDTSLIEDLVLYVSDHKKAVTHNPMVLPTFKDLLEKGDSTVNPSQVRHDLVEMVVPNLVDLGVDPKVAYRSAQRGGENQSRAVRFLAWLTGQDFMADLPQLVQTERAGRSTGWLKLGELARITFKELERQIRIYEAERTSGRHYSNVSYERDYYEAQGRLLKQASSIAQKVLFKSAE